jgi:hypothetical protein
VFFVNEHVNMAQESTKKHPSGDSNTQAEKLRAEQYAKWKDLLPSYNQSSEPIITALCDLAWTLTVEHTYALAFICQNNGEQETLNTILFKGGFLRLMATEIIKYFTLGKMSVTHHTEIMAWITKMLLSIKSVIAKTDEQATWEDGVLNEIGGTVAHIWRTLKENAEATHNTAMISGRKRRRPMHDSDSDDGASQPPNKRAKIESQQPAHIARKSKKVAKPRKTEMNVRDEKWEDTVSRMSANSHLPPQDLYRAILAAAQVNYIAAQLNGREMMNMATTRFLFEPCIAFTLNIDWFRKWREWALAHGDEQFVNDYTTLSEFMTAYANAVIGPDSTNTTNTGFMQWMRAASMDGTAKEGLKAKQFKKKAEKLFMHVDQYAECLDRDDQDDPPNSKTGKSKKSNAGQSVLCQSATMESSREMVLCQLHWCCTHDTHDDIKPYCIVPGLVVRNKNTRSHVPDKVCVQNFVRDSEKLVQGLPKKLCKSKRTLL